MTYNLWSCQHFLIFEDIMNACKQMTRNNIINCKSHWDILIVIQQSIKSIYFFFLPRYSFYDGPPFATGLPHYGHILAGTIKDVVTRYAHQSGFHVDRRFGWDCHGLPIVRIKFVTLTLQIGQDIVISCFTLRWWYWHGNSIFNGWLSN